jgi:hypothetical protein
MRRCSAKVSRVPTVPAPQEHRAVNEKSAALLLYEAVRSAYELIRSVTTNNPVVHARICL